AAPGGHRRSPGGQPARHLGCPGPSGCAGCRTFDCGGPYPGEGRHRPFARWPGCIGGRMNGGVLVLSWLVLAHLLADFVLQPDHVATRKFGRGPDAWRALGTHVVIVGLVAAPIALVYGLPGIGYLVVTVVTHLLIDRTKIEATLRMDQAPAASEPPGDPEMVPGWSPMPGVWFLVGQVAHLGVLVGAWALLLARATPLDWWNDLVARIEASGDGDA